MLFLHVKNLKIEEEKTFTAIYGVDLLIIHKKIAV